MNGSAADIRSALSLENNVSTGSSQLKRQNLSSIKKPDGISRELYSLIGPSAPTLVTQLTKPRLKQKPNLGIGTRVRWYDFSLILIPFIVFIFITQGNAAHLGTKDEQMTWNSNIGWKLVQIPIPVKHPHSSLIICSDAKKTIRLLDIMFRRLIILTPKTNTFDSLKVC